MIAHTVRDHAPILSEGLSLAVGMRHRTAQLRHLELSLDYHAQVHAISTVSTNATVELLEEARDIGSTQVFMSDICSIGLMTHLNLMRSIVT